MGPGANPGPQASSRVPCSKGVQPNDTPLTHRLATLPPGSRSERGGEQPQGDGPAAGQREPGPCPVARPARLVPG